jgi:SmpA / OmlA family
MRDIQVKKRNLLVMSAFALVAICAVIYWRMYDETNGWPKEPFSSEAWRTSSESDHFRQVRDLVDRALLVENTPEQVERLLGRPSYSSPDSAYWLYIVRTRREGDAGFDAAKVLQVDFTAGRVKKVWVRGD